MATARQFGVKPISTSYGLPGYSDHVYLLVQDAAADQNSLGQLPPNSGMVWYVGPDESVHTQIIAYTIGDPEAGNYPSLFNSLGDQGDDGTAGVENTARIAFKGNNGTNWTNEEFIALAAEIAALNGDIPKITIEDALTYINNGSHWTNFQQFEGIDDGDKVVDEYNYYQIKSCEKPDSANGILKTPSTVILAQEEVYDFSQIMLESESESTEWSGTTAYIVVGTTELTNNFGYDPDPKPAICPR